MAKVEARRRGFSLQLTERCNLECRYCYVLRRKQKEEDCSPALCERFVDFALRESSERLKITFFGGEPLLRPDLIGHTVEYGRAAALKRGKDLSFHVITNGTLLDDENSDFIAGHRIGLEISIDGPASVHDRNRPYPDGSGSFASVYSNLCRFVDRHPDHPVSIFSVITSPASTKSLPWLRALSRAIEAESFTANPCRMPLEKEGMENENHAFSHHFLNERLEAVRDSFLRKEADFDREVGRQIASFLGRAPAPCCGAGADAIIVTQSGQIFPCPMFVGRQDMVIGDIWAGFCREKSEAFSGRNAAAGCGKCRARPICGGGCAYDGYEQSGRVDLPAPAACRTVRDYAGRLEKTLVELASKNPEQLLGQIGLLPEKGRCKTEEPCRSVPPHSYVVRLTDRCNLACDYCYEKGRVRGDRSMDRATAQSVVRRILRGPAPNPTVCLFGGEPLLNWETGRFLIEEIAAKGPALGKKPFFHLTTNGTNITPEISRTIARFDVTVQVSIDGPGEKHDRHRKSVDGAGSFDRVVRGVEMLFAENPAARLDAQVVLTPGNTDMVQIAKYLTEMHFRRISFLTCAWAGGSGADWSVGDIGELERSREAFFPFFLESVCRGRPGIDTGFAAMVRAEPEGLRGLCECGAGEVFIDTAGSIYRCPQLFAAGVAAIGHCDSPRDLQPDEFPVGIDGECRECWAFERCRGGCLVHCRRCPWMASRLAPEKRMAWCDLMRRRFAGAIIARGLIEARSPGGLRALESMFES